MRTPTELHAHYARGAIACGHAPTCRKVTANVNWPTIMGRATCDCGRGEPLTPNQKRDLFRALAPREKTQ